MSGLVIEEEMEDSSIASIDHDIELQLVTQFGECEKILRSENVRNIDVRSVCQIAEDDSVSLVVRRAIQRGMALKKAKKQYGFNSSEEIIDEIIQLGTLAIGEGEMKMKEIEIFTLYIEKNDFVLTNEQSFQNAKDFRDKIEEFIRIPLPTEAEWTTIQKIGKSFSVIAGAAIAGFIAAPS